MTPDSCRPVEVTVDGQPETIRVHGGAAPSDTAAEALAAIVAAVRDRLLVAEPTVRQFALAVLKAHWPEDGHCRCGSVLGANSTLWSVHVLGRLAEAGVTVPLDETAVAR